MTKHKLDCGDNSCMFAENKTGARTNGGCRCTDNLGFSKSQTKAFREMAYAVIELREKLAEAKARMSVQHKAEMSLRVELANMLMDDRARKECPKCDKDKRLGYDLVPRDIHDRD